MSAQRRAVGAAILVVSLLGAVPVLASAVPSHDHASHSHGQHEYDCQPSGDGGPDVCVHGSQPVPDHVSPTRRPSIDELRDRRARARDGRGRPSMSADAETNDGTATTSDTDWQISCIGDGISGNRVQAVYVYKKGSGSRLSKVLPYIKAYAADVDLNIRNGAKDTGGDRRVRFVTRSCELDVMEVAVTGGSVDSFLDMIHELEAKGLDRKDRKYLIWSDTAVSICGVAQVYSDDRGSQDNRNNRGPQFARVDSPCWDYAETHELVHALGAVQPSAPHATRAGHCVDEYDVMCYDDGTVSGTTVQCSKASWNKVDCGSDDYFDVSPGTGSYLAKYWNVADSTFLETPSSTGSDSTATSTTSGGGTRITVFADLDGNDRDELLLYSRGTGLTRVYDISLSGSPVRKVNEFDLAVGWDEIIAGDYDGDGDDELSFYRSGDGRFATYAGRASGGLGARLYKAHLLRGWTGIFSGDHNGNGRDQLTFYRGGDGRYASYRVRPDSRLGTRTYRANLLKGWSSVFAGDFNDNGRDQVTFYRRGDGRFASYVTSSRGSLSRRTYRANLMTGWDMVEANAQDRSDGDLVTFYRTSDGRLASYATSSRGGLRSREYVGTL